MAKVHPALLATRRKFVAHMLRNIVLGVCLIYLALVIGMIGYHHFEKMHWVDAFVNASMILSGMGPMGELKTSEGKIFAGCYALFSGLFFILVVGIIFAPLAHRTFKKFKIDDDMTTQGKS